MAEDRGQHCIIADLDHGIPVAIAVERVRAVIDACIYPVPTSVNMGIVGIVVEEERCVPCLRLGGSTGRLVVVETQAGQWGIQVRGAERIAMVTVSEVADGWFAEARQGAETLRWLDVDAMALSFAVSDHG
jgi:hypothetical protein